MGIQVFINYIEHLSWHSVQWRQEKFLWSEKLRVAKITQYIVGKKYTILNHNKNTYETLLDKRGRKRIREKGTAL